MPSPHESTITAIRSLAERVFSAVQDQVWLGLAAPARAIPFPPENSETVPPRRSWEEHIAAATGADRKRGNRIPGGLPTLEMRRDSSQDVNTHPRAGDRSLEIQIQQEGNHWGRADTRGEHREHHMLDQRTGRIPLRNVRGRTGCTQSTPHRRSTQGPTPRSRI